VFGLRLEKKERRSIDEEGKRLFLAQRPASITSAGGGGGGRRPVKETIIEKNAGTHKRASSISLKSE